MREALTTAAPEDLRGLAAVRADEGAHVLDEADDGHRHAPEHRQRLLDVGQGDVLRRRHEQGAADRHRLRERELGVRGARRHVHDEVVELAPVDVAEELLDGAADERASPDDGLARRARRTGSR